ncbi:MAG TPA: hypothetical protein VER39_11645 [Nocardioidaceae bacterium]|nr:hypothetical protein [Nocardioidaceae bacterium]
MSSHLLLRPIGVFVALGAAIGVAVDAGSVAVTRMSAAHKVEAVGQAAAGAVKGRPVTSATAALALRVAHKESRPGGLQVQGKSFRLYRDGRVHLIATTTAPTMVLQHLEPLRHLTHVTATATVTPSPYS